MRKSKKGSFGRRGFLKGAAAGAAAFVAGPVAGAQQAPPAQSARAVGIVPPAGAVAGRDRGSASLGRRVDARTSRSRFMANRYQRGATYENTHTGTGIEDPNIDFAMLARSMGLYGEGPISDPKDLGPALRRAVERVERGEVALLDVVTQPR